MAKSDSSMLTLALVALGIYLLTRPATVTAGPGGTIVNKPGPVETAPGGNDTLTVPGGKGGKAWDGMIRIPDCSKGPC